MGAGYNLLMNITNLCQLLLGTEQLIVKHIVVEPEKISLMVEITTCKAICPICQAESREIHSSYMRFPIDLAWADRAVIFNLKVKRFFCRNQDCPKRTFAERFPGIVLPYARRTNRVTKKQQRISVNTCARTAEKLLAYEQIRMSDSTVNRIIRELPEPEANPIRVLGVDDWAKRKGQRYGTILVDLERGQIIDILGDRTADTLAQWLKEHPEVEIVSRDRSQTYAEAITKGAPEAVQVADRWHLLQNLSEAVFKILQQEYDVIKKHLEQFSEPEQRSQPEVKQSDDEKTLTPAEERRKERMERTKQLLQQGWTQKSVAHHLNIHPKTVRRYRHSTSPKSRRSRFSHLLAPFKPYILQRWNEGCHNAAQLYREIKPQGFAGETSIVRLFVRQLRQASGIPPKVRNSPGRPLNGDPTKSPPSLRKLSSLIVKRPENRLEEDETILKKISAEQPKLMTTIKLARMFAEIVRQQQPKEFDPWLEQASKSGYRVWHNFAEGLRQDYKAVRAAVELPWSNGPTEGHINRLKYLKRMMYGRGNDDLLRKRIIWQGRWSFT
jgi:transposase